MTYRLLLIGILILSNHTLTRAQAVLPAGKYDLAGEFEKKIKSLTHQNTLLRNQIRQSTLENQRQQFQITALQKMALVRKDSILQQQVTIGGLDSQVAKLTAKNLELEAGLIQRTAELKSAATQIAQLEYDKKNLVDKRIVRIYNFSADDVRKQLVKSLSAPESGFQYDDGLIDDEIKITRNFNDQAEAWWIFDKTLDTILELKVKVKPHLYDAQKALVFSEAKVLQKTRYSNKPFEEQHDREKVALYSEKTLHLLEGKLSGTSDK